MALPSFLRALPASARKAYGFIRSAFRQGISARAMESVIRDTITPISRTTINAVVLGIRGVARGVADLRFLKKGAVPDPTRMRIAKGKILTNYSFTFRIEGTVRTTGLLVDEFVQVTTDKLLSGQEMDDLVEEIVGNVKKYEILDDTKFTLEEALISEDAPLFTA